MNASVQPHLRSFSLQRVSPLFILLNPGKLTLATAISFAIGLTIGWSFYFIFDFPLWTITLFVLLALTPVGIIKWREDRQLYGQTVMLLSILLIAQGVHSIEHLTQWVQYYILYLPARQSNGLLSAANAEWVHFTWNWLVLTFVVFLIRGGMKNPWMFLLLGVASAHAFEHTYTFTRHLIVLSELRDLQVLNVTAQGLPGIIGRDGWLARSAVTQGSFLSVIPGVTTAMRLDVHFWWNMIEMAFLLAAAHVFLKVAMVKPAPEKPAPQIS
jgi:hypothetical protein